MISFSKGNMMAVRCPPSHRAVGYRESMLLVVFLYAIAIHASVALGAPTTLSCSEAQPLIVQSDTWYQLEDCSSLDISRFVCAQPVGTPLVNVSISVRNAIALVQFANCNTINISVVYRDTAFTAPSNTTLLFELGGTDGTALLMENVSVTGGLGILQLFAEVTGSVSVAMIDSSILNMSGPLLRMLCVDVSLSLRVVRSNVTITSNRYPDAGRIPQGGLIDQYCFKRDCAGVNVNISSSHLSCMQVDFPMLEDPSGYGCIHLEVIHPFNISNVTVLVERGSTLHTRTMDNSVSSGFNDGHFLRLRSSTNGLTPLTFPLGYTRYHGLSINITSAFATTSSASHGALVYIDTGVISHGSVYIANTVVEQVSVSRSAPFVVMRILSIVITAAQTGFEDSAIYFESLRTTQRMLSGAVSAVNSSGEAVERSLSNVRSALMYIFFAERSTFVVINCQLVATITGGKFVQRGAKRPLEEFTPMLYFPLGIVTSFLVQFQSETGIYVATSQVLISASRIDASISFDASDSIKTAASLMPIFYNQNISMYGSATGILSVTSTATNVAFTVEHCQVLQSTAGPDQWLHLRKNFDRATLMNITGILVAQSTESALQHLAVDLAGAIQQESVLAFLYDSALSVFASCYARIVNCSITSDSIGARTATAFSIAQILIPPNNMLQDSSVVVEGCSSTTSNIAPLSAIGTVSVSTIKSASFVSVTQCPSLNYVCYTPVNGSVVLEEYAALDVDESHFVSSTDDDVSAVVAQRFFLNGTSVSLRLQHNTFAGFATMMHGTAHFTDLNGATAGVIALGCNAWRLVNNAGSFRALTVGDLNVPRRLIAFEDPSTWQIGGLTIECTGFLATLTTPLSRTVSAERQGDPLPVRPSVGASAAASTAAVVGAVVGSYAGAINPVFLQVAMLSLRLSGEDCSYDVGLLESPTSLTIGSGGIASATEEAQHTTEVAMRARGAVVGNTLVLLGGYVSCVALLALLSVVVERRRYQRGAAARGSSQHREPHYQKALRLEVLARASLPGAIITPLALLLEPTVSASLFLLTTERIDGNSTSSTSVVIGVLGMVSMCLATGWLIFKSANTIGCHAVPQRRRDQESPGVETDAHYCIPSTWPSTVQTYLALWTKPRWKWIPTTSTISLRRTERQRRHHHDGSEHGAVERASGADYLAMYGVLFEGYRPRRNAFVAVELGISVACGVVGGVTSALGCTASLWLLLCIACSCLVAAVCRPFTSYVLESNFVVNAVMTVAVCLLALLLGEGGIDASAGIVYAQLTLTAFQMAAEWYGGFLHGTSRLHAWWRWMVSVMGVSLWRRTASESDASHWLVRMQQVSKRRKFAKRRNREAHSTADAGRVRHSVGTTNAQDQLSALIEMITSRTLNERRTNEADAARLGH